MRDFLRMGKTVMPFSGRGAFLLSVFLTGAVLFTAGCNKAPLVPDVNFAEKYLKEQTYNHCMRYQRIGTVYDTGKDGYYVFFSAPEEINYNGWEVKNTRKDFNFSCMFRRYNNVGQVYHKLINFHITPLQKTGSEKYTHTATMKIEFICMDKMYHDDSEYNAGLIWLYETKKYADFNKSDLQNQFGTIWKPGYDLLLLTGRILKDTSSEKKIVREVPLRYDSENFSWQWRNSNGKWLDDFTSETKLGELPKLPNADLLDADIAKFVSPEVTQNNKLMILDYAAYLCDSEYETILTRFLNDEILFFCPGQKDPMWLAKEPYKASKSLLELANKIMIEKQKVSPWQALQALNKYYLAVAPLQDIIWDQIEKDLKKVLDMLCNTDFIENEKKEVYLNKFIRRLGECSNLKNQPRYGNIVSTCTERLKKVRAESNK
jgi:hypothetical protein